MDGNDHGVPEPSIADPITSRLEKLKAPVQAIPSVAPPLKRRRLGTTPQAAPILQLTPRPVSLFFGCLIFNHLVDSNVCTATNANTTCTLDETETCMSLSF